MLLDESGLGEKQMYSLLNGTSDGLGSLEMHCDLGPMRKTHKSVE